jgi:hypothetical protein
VTATVGWRARARPAGSEQIERARQLLPGDRVRFSDEKQARFKVKAASERFVVLTKPFNAKQTYIYTIIDLEQGVRGPDSSWGTGYGTDEDIADAMVKLYDGIASVSPRRSVTLDIADVKAAA